jgi:hypothetical protein
MLQLFGNKTKLPPPLLINLNLQKSFQQIEKTKVLIRFFVYI